MARWSGDRRRNPRSSWSRSATVSRASGPTGPSTGRTRRLATRRRSRDAWSMQTHGRGPGPTTRRTGPDRGVPAGRARRSPACPAGRPRPDRRRGGCVGRSRRAGDDAAGSGRRTPPDHRAVPPRRDPDPPRGPLTAPNEGALPLMMALRTAQRSVFVAAGLRPGAGRRGCGWVPRCAVNAHERGWWQRGAPAHSARPAGRVPSDASNDGPCLRVTHGGRAGRMQRRRECVALGERCRVGGRWRRVPRRGRSSARRDRLGAGRPARPDPPRGPPDDRLFGRRNRERLRRLQRLQRHVHVDGSKLTFGPLASTKKACPDPVNTSSRPTSRRSSDADVRDHLRRQAQLRARRRR